MRASTKFWLKPFPVRYAAAMTPYRIRERRQYHYPKERAATGYEGCTDQVNALKIF